MIRGHSTSPAQKYQNLGAIRILQCFSQRGSDEDFFIVNFTCNVLPPSRFSLPAAPPVSFRVGSPATAATPQDSTGIREAAEEIRSILDEQTAAWNDGDLPRFMQPYWKSADLTFSAGGKTTRGWQATLDRYVRRYAPPKEMGTLSFDHLETTIIANDAALVLGDWHLKMNKGADQNGNFSLVLRKIDDEWKIIHDHSSSIDNDKAETQD